MEKMNVVVVAQAPKIQNQTQANKKIMNWMFFNLFQSFSGMKNVGIINKLIKLYK